LSFTKRLSNTGIQLEETMSQQKAEETMSQQKAHGKHAVT
jgi:hypothetical protein